MDLTLILTHECNLRCGYCYMGEKKQSRMDRETACRAIDFAASHLGGQRKAIGFFGGEPLLEWDILRESAEYFENKFKEHDQVKKTVSTNGMLLDSSKSEWLKENNFYVGLSVDGNEKMHNRLRRDAAGAGSFERVRPALKNFTDMQLEGAVLVVPDPGNIRWLYESVVWLAGLGIRNISLNPNFYTKWRKTDLNRLRKAYLKIGAFYLGRYRKGSPLNINFLDGKIMTGIMGGYRDCDRCDFGMNEISVTPSGNIYPCERMTGDDTDLNMRIGHIESGFDEEKRREILRQRGNVNARVRHMLK